jgi:hypothetical protein
VEGETAGEVARLESREGIGWEEGKRESDE